MPKTLQESKPMGCQHGRPQGSPCPHCLGINNPEDNQWEIRIADKINRYRDGYGQLTHIIADIQSLLSQQAEKQREEIERAEKALASEKNLDKISFYEGYIKGLKFKDLTNNKN